MEIAANTTLVTIQIPARLYAQLRFLAETQHTDLVEIIEHSLSQKYMLSSVDSHRRRVDELLLAAGLCRSTPLILTTALPLTTEERDEIAYRVGTTGRPLSEIILEEREGR